MKSMQFFINEELAKEIISFVEDPLNIEAPYNLKIFALILKDEFQKGDNSND